jgi:hypothetical protein
MKPLGQRSLELLKIAGADSLPLAETHQRQYCPQGRYVGSSSIGNCPTDTWDLAGSTLAGVGLPSCAPFGWTMPGLTGWSVLEVSQRRSFVVLVHAANSSIDRAKVPRIV